MDALETPFHFKEAAESALAEGDHMLAMDLFGEAGDRAYAEGLIELADECAQQVLDVIYAMAAIDGIGRGE